MGEKMEIGWVFPNSVREIASAATDYEYPTIS